MKMNPTATWSVHELGNIEAVLDVVHVLYPVHEDYMSHVHFGMRDDEDDPESVSVDVSNLLQVAALMQAVGSRCRFSLEVRIDEGKKHKEDYQFYVALTHDCYFSQRKNDLHTSGTIREDAALAVSQKRIADAVKILEGGERED